MLSYAIAGFICILVALVYAEVGSMIPSSGSLYTYSYVAYGVIIAWIVGGIFILELSVAAATVACGWSAYVQHALSAMGINLPDIISKVPCEGGVINLPATLIVLFLGFILYLGTKDSKKLNTALVFIKIGTIFLFCFYAAPHFKSSNWSDFMPFGADSMIHGAAVLFFAFTGFSAIATTAEECKNPKRDMSIGIIGSLILSTLLYIVVAGLLTGAVNYQDLIGENSKKAIVYALSSNGSRIGSAIVSTGAICGMTSVIMLNIYAQSRIFYAISRDGLLPKSLAKLHKKYDSPYIIIAIFTLAVAVMAASCRIQTLGNLASMGAILDYIIICTIVLVLRRRMPDFKRPFKCPAVFIIAPAAIII
jgi:APA family basic amino acid/polyamine antiporter